mgnify:CR=1 FL=1|jgi:hypothetical protein
MKMLIHLSYSGTFDIGPQMDCLIENSGASLIR